MRHQYDACCHGSMDAVNKCWGNQVHKQLVTSSRRYQPRRSLQQKRVVKCHTAVERVGHETDILLDPCFNGHLKLTSSSSAHRLSENDVEGPESLSTSTIINRRIKSAAVLPELLEVIVERGSDFSHANTSHAFNRLAKLYRAYGKPKHGEPRISPEVRQAVVAEYVEPAVSALTVLTQCKLHEYEPWDTATSLWAAAVLKLANSPVVESLLSKASQLADSYMPADISNTVWACAKLQIRPVGLLKHLVPVSVEQLQLFKPSEVAILIWAYAKLDFHPGHDLLEAVAEHVLHNLPLFPPQETSNVMWGMAKLGYRNDLALPGLEQHLLQQKAHLLPQDISNSLWSCAKVGYCSEPMLEELGVLAVQQLRSFKPQELTNLVYAHAALGHPNQPLLDAVAQCVMDHTADFSCQELVTVLWSFSRLQYLPPQPQFLTTLLSWLVSERMLLSPQGVANLVKSLAKLRYCPDALTLELLAKRSISCMSDFKPGELTNLLWGYATLGSHHEQLFDSAITQMQVWLTTQKWRITSQHINSVLYSCELLGFCPRELVDLAEAQGVRRLRVRRAAPSQLPLPSLSASTSAGYSASTTQNGRAENGRASSHSTMNGSGSAVDAFVNGVHKATSRQSHANGSHAPYRNGSNGVHNGTHKNGHANGHAPGLEDLPEGWNFEDFRVSETDPELADRIASIHSGSDDVVETYHERSHALHSANGACAASTRPAEVSISSGADVYRNGNGRYLVQGVAHASTNGVCDELAAVSAAGLGTAQDAGISNIVLSDFSTVMHPVHANGTSKVSMNGRNSVTTDRLSSTGNQPHARHVSSENIIVH